MATLLRSDNAQWQDLEDLFPFSNVPHRGRHVFHTAYAPVFNLLLACCGISHKVAVVYLNR